MSATHAIDSTTPSGSVLYQWRSEEVGVRYHAVA